MEPVATTNRSASSQRFPSLTARARPFSVRKSVTGEMFDDFDAIGFQPFPHFREQFVWPQMAVAFVVPGTTQPLFQGRLQFQADFDLYTVWQ